MGAHRVWIGWASLLVIAAGLPAPVAAARLLEPLGWWPERSDVDSMMAIGDFVYLLEENREILETLRITSDGLTPVGLAILPDDYCSLLAVDDRALILRSDGIQIYDRTDPEAPWWRAGLEVESIVAAVPWWPHLFLLSRDDAGSELICFDWRDRWKPVELSRHVLGFKGYQMVRAGDHLVISSDGALRVIDVSEPRLPRLKGAYGAAIWSTGYHLSAAGSLVLLSSDDGQDLVDVSDPWNPRGCGPDHSVSWDCLLRDLAIEIRSDECRIDRVDPGLCTWTPVSRIEFEGEMGTIESFGLAGDRLVLGDSNEILVLDLTDPESPVWLRTPPPGRSVESFLTWGPYLALQTNEEIQIFDGSDPTAMSRIATIEERGRIRCVMDGIILCDHYDALSILDVWDPYHPAWVGELRVPDIGSSVVAGGDHAYAICTHYQQYGLYSLDLTRPEEPRIASFLEMEDSIWSLTLAQGRLYGATPGKEDFLEIQVYDLYDPGQPQPVGEPIEIRRPGSSWFMKSDGRRLLIGDRSVDEVVVLSLADPLLPEEIGRCSLPPAGTFALGDELLVRSGSMDELVAYDLPALPQKVQLGETRLPSLLGPTLAVSDRGIIWARFRGLLASYALSGMPRAFFGGIRSGEAGARIQAWSPNTGLQGVELIWDGLPTGVFLDPRGDGWFDLEVELPPELPPGRYRIELRGQGCLPWSPVWPVLRVPR